MRTGGIRHGAALLIDLLILTLVVAVALTILTGGGVLDVAGRRISVRSVDNPLILITALLVVRYRARHWAPLFGFSTVHVDDLVEWSRARCAAFDALARTAPLRRWTIGVGVILAVAVALKLWLAWAHPGFHRGDDVEIHEMTLGRLLQQSWPVWSIRSAAFPMAFVYPVQYVAQLAGITDTHGLVFAGRAVVAVLSTFCVWITWMIGRRVLPGAPGYAALAAALVAANKLQMSFGSSEFPNPVAASLVACAFLLLLKERSAAAVAAGSLLGVAATFRFSEFVFLVPATLGLAWQGRWLHAVLAGGAAVIAAAAVLAGADAWYWGAPFYSIRQAIDFTLVQRLSSGGFQPAQWYATHVGTWSTWVVVILALYATRRSNATVALWAWTPIVLLSLFPHKEERYLITVTPFLSLLAADSVRRLIEPAWVGPGRRGRPAVLELALIAGLLMSLGHEAAGWRLRRSDADVALARGPLARETRPGARMAIEQAWRVGGQLYLTDRVVEVLDPAAMSAPGGPFNRESLPDWIILDRGTVEQDAHADTLRSKGYHELAHATASTYRVFGRR